MLAFFVLLKFENESVVINYINFNTLLHDKFVIKNLAGNNF